MEETDCIAHHQDAMLITCLDHCIVTQGTSTLHNIGNTTQGSPVYIIPEGEEGITGKAYTVN
jgi:hypothetical protein